MAEFCLKCLQGFEPNANEHNTELSEEPEFCEGCGEIKPVVVKINDSKERI